MLNLNFQQQLFQVLDLNWFLENLINADALGVSLKGSSCESGQEHYGWLFHLQWVQFRFLGAIELDNFSLNLKSVFEGHLKV